MKKIKKHSSLYFLGSSLIVCVLLPDLISLLSLDYILSYLHKETSASNIEVTGSVDKLPSRAKLIWCKGTNLENEV